MSVPLPPYLPIIVTITPTISLPPDYPPLITLLLIFTLLLIITLFLLLLLLFIVVVFSYQRCP